MAALYIKTYVHLGLHLGELLLGLEMFQTTFIEKTKTRFMFNNFFQTMPFVTCGQHCRDGEVANDSVMRHIRFACWVTKATETNSEYIISIAFPHQQRLRERASILRYTYVGFHAD